MKLQIVEKLRSELVQPISAERQVVYILVETRKLLDMHETGTGKFETLEFYCDWAMHVQLDRRTARTLLAKVDSYYPRLFQSGITSEEHRLLSGILCLEAFRGEFERFLGIHDLPVNICSTEDWTSFVRYYSLVIEDCPLVCENRNESFQNIDRLVFTRVPASSDDTDARNAPLFNSVGAFLSRTIPRPLDDGPD